MDEHGAINDWVDDRFTENERLRERIRELEDTLAAIQSGTVDGILVDTDAGSRLYSRASAETPYRFLIEQMHDGAALVREDQVVIYCNQRFADMLGVPMELLLGHRVSAFLPEHLAQPFSKLLKIGVQASTEQDLLFRGADGEESSADTYYLFGVAPYSEVDGGRSADGHRDQLYRLVSLTLTDISAVKLIERTALEYQKNLEEEVARKTQLLRQAQRIGKIGSFEYSVSSGAFVWSDELCRLHGIEPGDAPPSLDKSNPYYPEDQAAIFRANFHTTADSATQSSFDIVAELSSGRTTVFSTIFVPKHDENGVVTHILGTMQDVTEARHDSELIQRELDRNTVLLRELYHRTKNNMHVISSMIRLRERSTHDRELTAVLRELESRVMGMALAHQKIYESNDLSRLSLKDYFNGLIDALEDFHSSEEVAVRFRADLSECMTTIDVAIPLGIVINELITNAFKYAFRGRTEGGIEIGLRVFAGEGPLLEISDDGIGLPEGFDIRTNAGIGLTMVVALIEGQLGGTIRVAEGPGTRFSITFDEHRYDTRV